VSLTRTFERFDAPDLARDLVSRALARRAVESITGATGATVDLSFRFVSPTAVYVNGLRVAPSDFSIDGVALTLATPLVASDVLVVEGFFRPA